MTRRQLSSAIKSALEEHQLIRRLLLVWVCFVITHTIFMFFEHYSETGAAQATVITGILGLLTAVIAFYQWTRGNQTP